MEKARGSAAAIKEIIKMGKLISADEMAGLADMAAAAGGSLTSLDTDGDWCGTGRIHFKWPPKKKDDFIKLLDKLVDSRINFEALINGIPVPEEIVLRISRQRVR